MTNGMHLFKKQNQSKCVDTYVYVFEHLKKYTEGHSLNCYYWLFLAGRNRSGMGKYALHCVSLEYFACHEKSENFKKCKNPLLFRNII